jgi:hypothetical protein
MFSLICGIQTQCKYNQYYETGHTKGRSLTREGGQKKEVKKVNMADVLFIQE